jgi:malate/lactate dehydrogenase
MERKELISRNVSIYKHQAHILNEVGKVNCKCLVVANPANTNCVILSEIANKLPKKNFTCLTRLDQNRATAKIASLSNNPIDAVKNIIIWGNHSSTQFPDINFGKVNDLNAKAICVQLNNFSNEEFIQKIQKRGAEILSLRKLSR